MQESRFKMAKKKRRETNSSLRKFSLLLWIISILFMIILGYFIYSANILPLKYFLAIVIVFVVLLSIHGIFILNKKTRVWLLIVLNIFTLLFMSVEAFAICKINDTLTFLRENLGVYFETDVYNIVVSKDSSFNSIQDIQNQIVKTVRDMDDMSRIEEALQNKVEVQLEYEETSIVDLLLEVTNDDEMIVLANSGNFDAMIQNDEEYESKVKILDTITIQTEVKAEETGIKVTEEPFVIYLSGIDTRSNSLPSRSLSDVNIIMAVNPTTKNILMVHIPRDYYVQIHGTAGNKDKLTHAGAIGGVDLSMATIEDLLEIEIPYYVRVNFNAVVNLVDAIGGININSDVDYSFDCYTDRGCTFHPGLNYVGGRCALAFARERYAYDTGDRHRGENQEQVIELIIDKVTSSSTLITNYSDILNAVSGTFETNLSMDDITSLVKMQIDDMASWNFESVNVDGTGARMPTYSYPNQNLYVMNPNMETVTAAIQKLNEVLGTPDE